MNEQDIAVKTVHGECRQDVVLPFGGVLGGVGRNVHWNENATSDNRDSEKGPSQHADEAKISDSIQSDELKEFVLLRSYKRRDPREDTTTNLYQKTNDLSEHLHDCVAVPCYLWRLFILFKIFCLHMTYS